MTRIHSLAAALAVVSLTGCLAGDAGGVRVVISPETAEIVVGNTQRFEAASRGSFGDEVTWSVVSGGGIVDASGLYTAPATRVLGDVAVVRAASRVAPSRHADAAVRLIDPPLVPRTALTAGTTEIQVLRPLPADAQLFVDGAPVAAESAPGGTLRFTAPPHARGPVDLRIESPGRDPETWTGAFRYVPTSFRLSGGELVRPCTGTVEDIDVFDAVGTGVNDDEVVVLCNEPFEIAVYTHDTAQGLVRSYSFGLDEAVTAWASVDLVGDARREIVVAIKQRAYVFPVSGPASVVPPIILTAPFLVRDFAFADVDVKPGTDVVLVGEAFDVLSFSHNPDDTFGPGLPLYSDPDFTSMASVDLADLDGVPPLDLAVGGHVKPAGSAVVIVRRAGAAPISTEVVPTQDGIERIRFADVVKNDAKMDLVVSLTSKDGATTPAQVLRNEGAFVPQDIGTGGAEAPDLWIDGNSAWMPQASGSEVLLARANDLDIETFELGTLWRGFTRLAIADVDGDLTDDLLLGRLSEAGGLLVLEPGVASPDPGLPPAFGPEQIAVPVAGLVNPQISGVRRDTLDGSVVAVLRETDATARGVAVVELEGSTTTRSVVFGSAAILDAFLEDLDSDGFDDVVAIESGGVRFAAGSATGTFPPVAPAQFAIEVSGTLLEAGAGDFDGDTLPDLVLGVAGTSGDSVYGVVWGDGSGTFDPAAMQVLSEVEGVGVLAVADLDEDGVDDVVASDQLAATVSIVHGRADRAVTLDLLELERPAGTITLDDVDGDGLSDLVISARGFPGYALDEVAVHLGRNGLLVQSSVTQMPTVGIKDVGVADLDGDLIPDLVVLAPLPALAGGAQLAHVFHGLGTGQFGARSEFSCGRTGTGAPLVVGAIAADVNGDGLGDLVCVGVGGLRTRRNLSQ